MKKGIMWGALIVGIIALLCLVIGAFDWAAEPIANAMGKPVEVVKGWARTAGAVAIGLLVVFAGISAIAAAPVLGVILLAVGIGTVVLSLWPVLSPDNG